MLFFVKYRLKNEKLGNLAEEVRSGGLSIKAKHVFTSREDPFVGLTIWEAQDQDEMTEILEKLGMFADISETIPVMSAKDAQERIFR
ncbi:hypothetical protein ACFL7D_10655, partial [candidate division KSB1 bacterium]